MEPIGEDEVAGLQAFADELQNRFMRMQNEALDLHKRAREVRVSLTSSDGLVTATVGARGDLIRLDIDPRVYRRPDSRKLADTITETVRKAAAAAQEKVLDIFEPLVPREHMKAQIEGDIERVMEQFEPDAWGK